MGALELFLQELAAKGRTPNSGMTQDDTDVINAFDWQEQSPERSSIANMGEDWTTPRWQAAIAKAREVQNRNFESLHSSHGKKITLEELAAAQQAGNPFPGMGGTTSPGGDMWLLPASQFAPRTSGGNGFLDALPWSEASREAYSHPDPSKSDMGPGLAVMFGGPALGFAGTAIAGAGAGAGAIGAGGAGSGTAGAGALGAEELGLGFAAGGAPEAGSGLLIGESAAGAGAGGEAAAGGGWFFDDFSGEWVQGAEPATTPFSTNPSTGDLGGNVDPNTGLPQGTSPSLVRQAQDLAKQFGITPASALQSLLKAAGRAAPAALGVLGASKQADSLQALADKYMALGAPSRARYEASFAPGFSMANEPGYKDALDLTTKSTLHGLSVGGNPAGSPNAWAKTLEDLSSKFAFPALQNFRQVNANTGGLASFAPASVNAANSAIKSEGDIFNAIGVGANSIFNPPQTLAEQLAELRRQGLY